ncbi:MAG: PAS domain S-box protein [Candidatus Binataceae bacterium]|nr:PAS domain S-box protein [Candidatus Binataceae bacterium]
MLVNEAAALAARGLGADLAAVTEVVEETNQLRCIANWGLNSEWDVGLTVEADGKSQTEFALSVDQPVVCNDLSAETRFTPHPRLLAYGICSGIAAPLRLRGRPLGVISAYSLKPHSYSRADASFMQAIADIIAGAMERERSGRALARKDDYLRAVLENSTDAIVMLDYAGTVRFINGASMTLVGLTPDQMAGRPGADFVHPDDLANRDRMMNEAIAHPGKVVSGKLRLRSNSGEGLECEIVMRALPDCGNDPGILVNVRDISERMRAARMQALLASIVASTDDSIVSMEPDCTLTSWNAGAERMYGYRADEVIGRRPDFMWMPEDASLIEACVQKLAAGSGTERYEIQRHRRDGRVINVAVTLSPIRDERGVLTGVAGIGRDVTESKRAAAELERARDAALEASRLKSAFLANMSHEVRTPINVILGYNDLIADHLASLGDDSQAEHVDAVGRASRRLMRTINTILDYSKMESGTFEFRPRTVRLGPLINRQVEEVRARAREKNLSLTVEIEAEDAATHGDEYSVGQAIAHLLDNAIKFTTGGGVRVRLYRGDRGLPCIAVSDTGIGIDERFQAHLFEPFRQEEAGMTRSFEGAGLGLALTRSYLELNQARISFESHKGSGTTFTIGFASSASAAGPAPLAPAADAARIATRAGAERPVIMVVEDDPDNLLYMDLLLKNQFDVLLASNGSEVHRIVATRREPIDLVLMDLSLRGADDGLRLTRMLRGTRRFNRTPVVAVTGHASPEDRELARAAGCDGFVTKPIERALLFETIERLLSRSRRAGAFAVR